ncbi:MAG TPA: DUF6518 family protein [Actinocrinis sp.]|nr:DUF6518 family protein [Actinocrinis sp.]
MTTEASDASMTTPDEPTRTAPPDGGRRGASRPVASWQAIRFVGRRVGPRPDSGWHAGFGTLLGLAVLVGTVVGVATDLLQAHLNSPWLALVNAASPWLAPAFAVGIAARRYWHAAVAGLLTCVVELIAYDVTAHVRGIAVSSGITAFWALCGVIGGPTFGVAGRLWRGGRGPLRGLGLALLASAFFGEAAIAYALFLNYYSSAALFAVIGAALIATLGRRGKQYAMTCVWLLATFPAAVIGELLLHLVYSQTF